MDEPKKNPSAQGKSIEGVEVVMQKTQPFLGVSQIELPTNPR